VQEIPANYLIPQTCWSFQSLSHRIRGCLGQHQGSSCPLHFAVDFAGLVSWAPAQRRDWETVCELLAEQRELGRVSIVTLRDFVQQQRHRASDTPGQSILRAA
jgi:hypothetical protein